MDYPTLETQILSHDDRLQGVGARPEDVAAAEAMLGVRILGGFRQFLQRLGWLVVGPIEIYGLGRDVPKHLNLIEITKSERTEMHPRLRPELIPVMNDGGGNLYCLDTAGCRAPENPPIVFWDHDSTPEQTPELIAGSFEEWLSEKLRDCLS
jgi:hypothetical protein